MATTGIINSSQIPKFWTDVYFLNKPNHMKKKQRIKALERQVSELIALTEPQRIASIESKMDAEMEAERKDHSYGGTEHAKGFEDKESIRVDAYNEGHHQGVSIGYDRGREDAIKDLTEANRARRVTVLEQYTRGWNDHAEYIDQAIKGLSDLYTQG